MKYIKKFENKKAFNIGDIIIYEADNSFNDNKYIDYFKKNPGEIVNYDFKSNGDYYIVHFNNLPKMLNYYNDNLLYINMKHDIRIATEEEKEKYYTEKESSKYNL